MALKYGGKHVQAAENRDRPWLLSLFFPLSLFYMELVVKFFALGTPSWRGVLFTALFTLPIGLFCALMCSLWGRTANRVLSFSLLSLGTLWCMVQTVYHTIFRTFLTFYSISGAEKAFQFWRDILKGILDSWLPLILLLLPLAALCVFSRRLIPGTRMGGKLVACLISAAVVVQAAALLAVNTSTGGVLSLRALYRDEFIPDLSVSNFGVLTTLRLDVTRLLAAPGSDMAVLGTSASPSAAPSPTAPPSATPAPEPSATQTVYSPNVLVDFEKLAGEETDGTLKAMHQYFGSREPTLKNEYTGRFAGKNLIFLTAEGFSRFAVDKELTPTLYKLANEGFVFKNFYNPLWWVSTSDGEYAACTSLFPKSGVWSFYRSGKNALPFCMGNQLKALGYPTRAYHNHTWDYYHRDVSHPNMGYDYKGVGHGLEVKQTWPESDLEMMEKTLPEYIGDKPFHTYYMTVSGHMNYSFGGNAMAAKNRDAVAHLDLSEQARAYLACNIELDRALEYVLSELKKAGQLEDTVICMSPDHYPYGLDDATLNELAGHEVDHDFELYKAPLILWSGDMEEPVEIEKPCASVDILPTLSNLFGLPYDSRLMMGRDILSDSPGLAVFSNRSFITEVGAYNSRTDQFTPAEGQEAPEGYAVDLYRQIEDMFTYSTKILDLNYYAKVGLTTP